LPLPVTQEYAMAISEATATFEELFIQLELNCHLVVSK
jgi:hypothetical protein